MLNVFGPAISIDGLTNFGYISVSTIDLLGPGQHSSNSALIVVSRLICSFWLDCCESFECSFWLDCCESFDCSFWLDCGMFTSALPCQMSRYLLTTPKLS